MRLVLLCFIFIFPGNVLSAPPQVCMPKVCVDVETVKDREGMKLGLSGRESLGVNKGMLFIFNADGRHGFWMKDMKFALDILWLDRDGRVVDMRQNLSPCAPDHCPIYTPAKLARYVLEVNAGFAAGHGMKPGKILNIK